MPPRAPKPLAFLDDAELPWPAAAQWVLALLPLLVVAGVVAQRWSTAPHAGLLLLAAAMLLPFVADLFARAPHHVVSALLIQVPVITLLWWQPVRDDLAPFLLVMLAAIAGFEEAGLLSVCGVGTAVAIPIAAQVAGFEGAGTWVLGIVFGWVAGAGLRAQLGLFRRLRAAQDQLSAQAVDGERRRIAGELHDVVAHSLAVTVLHLTGARLALETDDRDEAMSALLQAEDLGRASLNDIRHTVGLLNDEAGTAPALPSAAEVPELVDAFRRAGLPVSLAVRGDLSAVAPASGLAVYRIVQESLANVVKHAPGAGASVEVRVEDDTAQLVVSNELVPAAPHAGGGGFGLRGMRERVDSLGGTLRTGPVAQHWLIEAVVPR